MTGRRVTPTATLVLPATAPHDRWLAARRRRDGVPGGYCIGSSDVPSILDLPGVDTPAHVWHDKVNALEKEQTDAMRFGQLFEEPIAFDWAARNHTAIRRIGLIANVDEPWQQTTLDRRVIGCPLGIEGGCSLEVKNVGAFVYKTRWHVDLPDYILAQKLHALKVTGFSHSHYAVCVGGNTPHQGVVYADRERDLMEYVWSEVNRFRTEHLLTGIAPAWTAGDKVDRYLELDARVHAGRTGEVEIDALDDVLAYAEKARQAGRIKKEKDRLKLALAMRAAGKEIVTVAGERAWYYSRTSRTNVDPEALRERYPDAYADPAVVSETTFYTLHVDSRIKKMLTEDEA